MAFSCGFFNSKGLDRTYTAENFTEYLSSIICNGILDTYGQMFRLTAASSGLKVTLGTGNTAQRMCGRCANRFFVSLHRNGAGILAYCKEFLCDMTENSSADAAHSRQAGFVRCCLKGLLLRYDVSRLQPLFFCTIIMVLMFARELDLNPIHNKRN